jgi:quercetin dioxygenase-like cupin family protein
MKTSLKTLAASALLTALVGGLPPIAKAATFEALGEGVLPSGKYVQTYRFTLEPGGMVSWHYHPGPIYVVIAEGTLTEDHGCGQPLAVITAGSAFSEPVGKIHQVFNKGSGNVVLIVTQIVPAKYAGYLGTIPVKGPKCED